MTKKRKRYYVQLYKDHSLTGDMISSATPPVKANKRSLGHLLGPFRTKQGAEYAAIHWDGEGDMTVAMAESLAKVRQAAKVGGRGIIA